MINASGKHARLVLNKYIKYTKLSYQLLDLVFLVESSRYHCGNMMALESGLVLPPSDFDDCFGSSPDDRVQMWQSMVLPAEYQAFLCATQSLFDMTWIFNAKMKKSDLATRFDTLYVAIKNYDKLGDAGRTNSFKLLQAAWIGWGKELSQRRHYGIHHQPYGGSNVFAFIHNGQLKVLNADSVGHKPNRVDKVRLTYSGKLQTDYCKEKMKDIDLLMLKIIDSAEEFLTPPCL